MAKPSYEELDRKVKDLERLLQGKLYSQDFVSNTKDLIYFKGYRNWAIEFFDRKIEALTGYELEDFLDRRVRWLDITYDDDRNIPIKAIESALKSDKYFKAEYRIVDKAGDIKWILIRGFILCGDKGEFLSIQGVLNDITSHKYTELALDSVHEIFPWFADNLDDGFYIISENYRIQYMNKALISLVGDHVGEVCYKALFQRDSVCPWSVRDALKEKPWIFQEYKLPGTDRIFQVSSLGIIMRNGSMAKMGLLRDVTHTRQLENEVKEFAVRHQAIEDAADKANLGICLIQDHEEIDARFMYANDAFCRITGYDSEELLKKSLADLVKADMRQSFIGDYRRLLAGNISTRIYDLKIVRKDGVYASITYSASLSVYGGKVAVTLFVRDITERKRVQQALWQSQRLASIGRLAAEIAHEMNNPLTSAVTFSKLLSKIVQQDPFPEERLPELREYITCLDAEASRCAGIAKGLLDFSRQGEIDIQENDLRDIINKTLNIIRHRSEMTEIRIVDPHGSSLPPLICDFKRLQQSFINIFWNAIQAMPEGGVLSVATSFDEEQQFITIDISDTGTGIAEEDLDRIFEPFFTTKPEGKGVGLGLSVAYGIIRQHQGQVFVESQIGKGTHFIIKLPIIIQFLHE